ncbi:MAG: hypothetical protein IPJ45_13450 [Ignavibacteria bacterium]|nr:hypothetical protein [Ignavibacteria bacterium]
MFQTPILDWNDVLSAAKYWVQVSTDSLFSTFILNDSSSTGSQFSVTPGKLNYNTKYYWRVYARNVNGWGTPSLVFKFTTIPGQLIKINLNVLVEGFYNPITNQMTRKDTVIVYLCQSISPYNKIDSAVASIDSNLFTGLLHFKCSDRNIFYSCKTL